MCFALDVTQGGLSNVTSMFLYLAQTFFGPLAPPTTTTGAAAAAGSRGDGSSPGQPFDLGKQLSQLASMVLSPGVGGGAASTAAAAGKAGGMPQYAGKLCWALDQLARSSRNLVVASRQTCPDELPMPNIRVAGTRLAHHMFPDLLL
jgi:hypothetical protein